MLSENLPDSSCIALINRISPLIRASVGRPDSIRGTLAPRNLTFRSREASMRTWWSLRREAGCAFRKPSLLVGRILIQMVPALICHCSRYIENSRLSITTNFTCIKRLPHLIIRRAKTSTHQLLLNTRVLSGFEATFLGHLSYKQRKSIDSIDTPT